jgi:hypothetical protein
VRLAANLEFLQQEASRLEEQHLQQMETVAMKLKAQRLEMEVAQQVSP